MWVAFANKKKQPTCFSAKNICEVDDIVHTRTFNIVTINELI